MKRLVVFLALLASMLSIKAAVMYVEISPDGSTLTFYYDDLKSSREGTVYGINEWRDLQIQNSETNNYSINDGITSAIFDVSFKDARPTGSINWFQHLINLKSIENLQYLNTSEVTYMWYMFYGCSSLESLDLSSFDTHKVKNMRLMFSGCSSLKSLSVSNFDTGNVKDMEKMFGGCSSLTNLDVSSFDTRNVTNMCGMFGGCSSLTNLDVSSFDTGNVADVFGMFEGCSSLTSLDVSNFDTHNMTFLSSMFMNCSSLTSLDLSNFDTSNVTDMNSTFYGCKSLTSIDLSSFNTSNMTTLTCMFCNCSSLKSVDMSNFDTRKVIVLRGMFFNCSSLEEIDLSHFNTGNVKFMDDMFENCSSLQSVDLSNFVTSKVTDMRGMFSGCSSLTSLDLSNFDTGSVTNMGNMLSGCSNLKSVDLSNFATSNVKDMKGMFSGCSSLTSLDLSNFDTGSVTSMGNMFSGCSNLTSLNLGSFNTGKVTNMKELFSGCSNLATLDISNFDISKIGQNYLSNMCKDVASAENPCLLKVPDDFDFREDIDFSGDYFMWKGGYFRLPETDKLKVEPITVYKGSPSTMAIELKNPSSEKYIGYQFKIVLPEGVSICKKDNGQYSYTQGNRYGNTQMMINIREQNDGSYMVLCFSLSNTPISGHEGAILSLDITSDGTLDDGSYDGTIRGIKFSTPEGSDVLLPDATFKVNVSKYELGDVNNDGSVSISDITLAVNYILGKASDKFHASHGDMNHDGEINISDLSEMVEIILNSGNNAPVNIGVTGGLRMESAGSECSLYLPDAGLYKGCQFLVRVPSGCCLSDVSVGAGRESGHRVMYRQTGTGLYKVLVFSADGDEFEDVPSALLRLTVYGQNGGAVELSDIRFTDTDFTEHGFAAVSSEVTGIGAVAKGASESTWYSLDGQKTAQPTKGVFVRDGRKIVVK